MRGIYIIEIYMSYVMAFIIIIRKRYSVYKQYVYIIQIEYTLYSIY